MVKKFNHCIRHRDLRELIQTAAKKYGDKPAFKEYGQNRKIVEHTFNQLKSDTEALGTKLLADGMKGKHFALIGESAYNYVISYLTVVNGVGVIVPIDKELMNDDIVKLLKKCDADAVFFSDAFLSDMPEILAQCPGIQKAIHIGTAANDGLYPYLQDLIASGRDLLAKGNTDYLNAQIDIEKYCTILFTSGTTGANKGVMLCQKNLTACLHSAMSLFLLPETNFSVLPINHTYEFNINVLGSIYGGATLCFNDSIKHVKDNLKVFKPYMSLMVPMIVEGLYKNIWKQAEKNHLAQQTKYGVRFSNFIRKFGIDKRKLFFAPIHENLGGNLDLIVCGGAPLNPDVAKGLSDFGIEIYNGYGTTECSPLIASNSPLSNKFGTVGVVVPDCTVRIADKSPDGTGEIQVKGDNVMLGYYKDPEATRNAFSEDGWLRTGDLGYLDKKGNLSITGRLKNLIILPNGKNVHPEELEDYLMSSIPYIQEVVVYAQLDATGNDSIIATEAYLDQEFMSSMGMKKALELFETDIAKVNRRLAGYKRIAKAHIREMEFEKTTTKKIKRNIANRRIEENA